MYRGEKRSRKPKTQTGYNIIKYVTNLFRLKRENELINTRITRDIRNLFEL